MTKILLSWNVMREWARNIAHNSTVKIEATTGKKMNKSKSGKNNGTAHILTRLGPISIDGSSWDVNPCMI